MRTLLLTFLLLGCLSSDFARASGFELSLSTGAAMPTDVALGDYPDVESRVGLALGAEASYFLSDYLGIDLTLIFNRNDFRGPFNLSFWGLSYPTYYDVGTQESLFLLPGIKIRYPGGFSPFAKIAVGRAFNSFDQNLPINISSQDPLSGRWLPGDVHFRSTDSASFLIGGGLDIHKIDSIFMGFTAQYHWNSAKFQTEASNGDAVEETDSSLSIYVLQFSLGFHF